MKMDKQQVKFSQQEKPATDYDIGKQHLGLKQKIEDWGSKTEVAINGKVKKGIELVEQLQNLSVFYGILNEKREAHDNLYQKTLEHIHSQMSKKPMDLRVEQVLKQYLKQVESQGQLIAILRDFKVDIKEYVNNVKSYNQKSLLNISQFDPAF